MGFVLDGLDAEAYDRHYSDGVLVRRIAAYFRPHIKTMVLVAVVTALGSSFAPISAVLISRGIDDATNGGDLLTVLIWAGIITSLGLFGWVVNYIRQRYTAIAVGDVVLKVREDSMDAVLARDMSFYDQYASGKVVSRVLSDTQDFSSVVTLTIELLSQVMLVLVVTISLFFVNPTLAWITLAVSPLVIIAALMFRRFARAATQQSQRASALVNSAVSETVSGIGVAKSFRREEQIYQEFLETNTMQYGIKLRQSIIFGSIWPVLNIISGLALVLLVYFGGVISIENPAELSPGDWYLFIQSVGLFFFPLTSIASFWSQFQLGLAASERVFALMDAEAKVVQTDNKPVSEMHGEVVFKDVRFAYNEESVVLRNFNLHIKPGEKIAIVGHTGAGKSSLVKILLRFYEFQGGQILIDGQDIRALDLAEYRMHTGLVPQVPFLFSGTVMENIRYGRPEASDDDVLKAAQSLDRGDWINDLPDGLKTDVGERGSRLSLGQRQLVALARVLLRNPSIFFLDEATASIDPFTEAQIQDGLDIVMQGRTSIVIAHRLSTVRTADRILVLKNGDIIEEGNHAALLAHGGHYAELYNTYFRHQTYDYRPWEN
ncbi:MAG: ABC transporter ATP-binding protein [Chloroflexi bacterium]|nr:ABC transporter ATP-binding protein [Chloroflexota bacterium]